MPKDFKIGLGLGLVLVAGSMVWIAVRSDDTIGSPAPYVERKSSNPERVPDTRLHSVEEVLNKSDESLLETLQAEADRKGQSGALQMRWPRIHLVEEGQTLSQISVQYYGTAGKWDKILQANRLRLKNKDQIRPGMRLVIPE